MNRRLFLRFLSLAPLGGAAAIVTARAAPAAETMWGSGVESIINAWVTRAIKDHERFQFRFLNEADHAEFKRLFIDPVLVGEVKSRRYNIDDICKFMGVSPVRLPS